MVVPIASGKMRDAAPQREQPEFQLASRQPRTPTDKAREPWPPQIERRFVPYRPDFLRTRAEREMHKMPATVDNLPKFLSAVQMNMQPVWRRSESKSHPNMNCES
jgi:hypothetical protein